MCLPRRSLLPRRSHDAVLVRFRVRVPHAVRGVREPREWQGEERRGGAERQWRRERHCDKPSCCHGRSPVVEDPRSVHVATTVPPASMGARTCRLLALPRMEVPAEIQLSVHQAAQAAGRFRTLVPNTKGGQPFTFGVHLRTRGNLRTGRALAVKTVRGGVHMCIRRSLAYAKHRRWISANPALEVEWANRRKAKKERRRPTRRADGRSPRRRAASASWLNGSQVSQPDDHGGAQTPSRCADWALNLTRTGPGSMSTSVTCTSIPSPSTLIEAGLRLG